MKNICLVKDMQMVNKSLKNYWSQLVSLCGLISCSLGICSNSQGVFFKAAAEDLHVMIGTFSMQNTVSYIIMSFFAMYVVRLADKVKYRSLLFVGAVLTGMSFVVMGFTSNLIVFYILGILRGIGAGTFAVAIVTVGINNWFKEKRGFVTSIVFCTSGITGMLLPPMFAYIIDKYTWRHAYVAMGIVSFLLILPALLGNFTLNPAAHNELPYGMAEKGRKKQEWEGNEKPGSVMVLPALISIAVIYNVILGFAQHLPAFGTEVGFSSQTGAMLLSMCMLGNVVFKFVSGTMSDKAGATKVTMLMAGVDIFSLVSLFFTTNVFVLHAESFLFGVMYSVVTVCLSLLAMDFFPEEDYNRKYPVISFAGGIANSAAVSVLGYMYDFSGSYRGVFGLLLVLHLAGFLLLVILSHRKA